MSSCQRLLQDAPGSVFNSGLERLSGSPCFVCLSPGFAPVTIETSRHTYEYVATALDWWQADRYCEQRFAQLLFEPQDSEQNSFSKLLQSHHIRGSVWLKERDSVLHKTKRRREYKWTSAIWRLVFILKNMTGKVVTCGFIVTSLACASSFLLTEISPSRGPHCTSPGIQRQNRHKICEGAL